VTCPSGTACVADEAGGLDKCLPTSPGGCGCRAGSRGAGLPAGFAALVAFGLVLVLRRRGSR
jgi:MYXO-CTERM domain-containing protein